MATSDTEVCNLALVHIGVTKAIANLTTERGTEASTCKTVYSTALQTTLRDFAWPFANTNANLALVQANPNDYYQFSYRSPADCEKIVKLWSGIRNDSRQSRVHFKIVNSSSGKLIYTDLENARANYTRREEDMSLWTSDFTLALSYKVAYMVAPALTKGDPFKLGDRAQQNYTLTIGQAKSNALNEEQPEEDVESEFIRTRE